MKDKLLNDDYIISFVGETYGKDSWQRVKRGNNYNEKSIKSILEYFRSKATAYEVSEDITTIGNKYHKLIAERFYTDDMTYSQREHVLFKAIFKIFFHDYIQEYPDTKSICNGIVFALDFYRCYLVYKEDGVIVDNYTSCLKQVNEYFDGKYLTICW